MKIDHKLKSEKAYKDTSHIGSEQPQSNKNDVEKRVNSKNTTDKKDLLNRSDFNKPFPKGPQISNGKILP